MTINNRTLTLISEFEGFRANAYPDPGSRDGTPWTIGYGHTKGVKKGDKVTKAQAKKLLQQDLNTAMRGVSSNVEVSLNENQYGALVSFAFNVGVSALKNSTLLRKLNDGDYDAVPAQLMRWVNNDGKYMKGLARRRAAEGQLWNTPVNTGEASVPKSKPVEEKQGKPAHKSTTNITTLVGYVTGVLSALQGLDTKVAIPVVIILSLVAAWIIRERMKKSSELGI